MATNQPRRRDILKVSLSKTLTHFYPLAGRVKDCYTIDCNDEGATYVEARVDLDMSIALKQPTIDLLRELLPCDPYEELPDDLSSQALVVVQVNHFACGGMAICVCIRHVVADASAASSFVKTWADIANGIDVRLDGVVCDCTSLFPPHDLQSLLTNNIERSFMISDDEVVTKRFVFYGSKIAALRDEINGNTTRFEAVSSLIWSALIAIAAEAVEEEENETLIPSPCMHTIVNLRKRMNLPFPQLCMGNICEIAIAEALVLKTPRTSLSYLAEKIHESVSKMDDTYVREFYGSGSYLNAFKNVENSSKTTTPFILSSWCKFPFYEVDFGWGKPVWFATFLRQNNSVCFLDSNDGKGTEAWIGLTKQEMTKFEQHPTILAYASFNPSILC